MTITRTGLPALVAAVLVLGTTLTESASLKCYTTSCVPHPVCGGEDSLYARTSCSYGASKPGERGTCCHEVGSVTSDEHYTVAPTHKCWIACMHGRNYSSKAIRTFCSRQCT
jgi:hypothetical protein